MNKDEFQEYLREEIHKRIKKHGQTVMGIFADEENKTPFSYTVGNHGEGHTELLLIGSGDVTSVLNALRRIRKDRGRAFENGEIVDIGAKFPVKIIDADERANKKFTHMVSNYYLTDDYKVQQVVVPDEKGRFPGEGAEGYWATDQLILGELISSTKH